ncbi:YrhB domain-containing protein [Streptomyces sp. NPDC048751]|uniref:YrhB domain-containing protein n=1 Tax=Streptomyces sp. NPDC048751 TaxID=3365591 RepID=UPI00371ACEC2
MYTQEQAEQLAADFLRRETVGSDREAVLVDKESSKGEKGDSFYFTYTSVEYLATGDDRHLLYGPPAIAVHKATGESRWVGMQEFSEVDPFDRRK